MIAANPGLSIQSITNSKGGDYRPFSIEGCFGEVELKRLERQVETIEETQALTQGDTHFGSADEESERIAWQKPIPFSNDFSWMYSKIQDTIFDLNSNTWNFELLAMLEYASHLRYKSSEGGKYDFHIDSGGDGPAMYRKLSVIVLLNDGYEGGDVLFQDYMAQDETQMIYPKTKGTMIIFPSFLRHAVTPVTKGERKSMVLWIHGKPFR